VKKRNIPWNKGLKGTPGGRYPKGHNRRRAICNTCHKEFEYYGCEGVRNCCSRACFHKYMIVHMKGSNKGSKNGNWKNGATDKTILIRESTEYRHWRKAVYERDNYTCQICHKRGVRLAADHIKPFALYPELRFELDNGRTLCFDCHIKTPTFARNARKAVVQCL
jgi:5-methylcytosine-specific restriction endonuclease McrA